MSALLLCLIAFGVTFKATKRSLGAGLVAAAAVGYFYGILRANFIQSASHFIFDSSLLGLYFAFGPRFFDGDYKGSSAVLRGWTTLLVAWPCLLSLLPFQPLMVSLVGLRGNTFFLPMLLVGARLKNSDVRLFTLGLALLNFVALGFGVAEYYKGIEAFFPRSAVTSIIYMSGDVAGGYYRIPSLFTSAHAYAGTMVGTIPFLFGAWAQSKDQKKRRFVILLGMVAALCGVLLASTRSYFAIAVFFVVLATIGTKLTMKKRILWIAAIGCIGALALTNERFQRFKSLGDSDMVMERIAGSVNRSFLEVLLEYPMGNGLGGGGTSMPYFLQGEVQHPVSIENEYSCILAEQGLIGLTLWAGFIVWCVTRRLAFMPHEWRPARRLIWYWYLETFVTSAIGIGMLTAIPGTFLFMLAVGWAVVVPAEERVIAAPVSQLTRINSSARVVPA